MFPEYILYLFWARAIKIKHPKRRYIAGFAIGAALFFFAYTFYKIAKQEAQDILDDQIRLKEEVAAKAEVYKALQRQGASAFVYDGRVSVHYPIWANRAELERLCRRLAILSLPFRGKAPIEALRTGDSTIAMIIAATGGLFLTAAAIYDWYNEYYAEFYYQRLTVIIQRLEQHCASL